MAESYSKSEAITPKWLKILFIILSAIGLTDAVYLTIKHFLGTPVSCSILQGCDKVLTSHYAVIFGVPVALLGALYYLSILALVLYSIWAKREAIVSFAARLTILGFLASLWFVYLQAFVIHDLCEYCLFSAVTSTALFVFGFWIKRRKVDLAE